MFIKSYHYYHTYLWCVEAAIDLIVDLLQPYIKIYKNTNKSRKYVRNRCDQKFGRFLVSSFRKMRWLVKEMSPDWTYSQKINSHNFYKN